jgi:hypothetical protein
MLAVFGRARVVDFQELPLNFDFSRKKMNFPKLSRFIPKVFFTKDLTQGGIASGG